MTEPSKADKNYVILFLAPDWWGSDARALGMALRSQGHVVVDVNEEDYIPLKWSSVPLKAIRRLSRKWMASDFNREVLRYLDGTPFDFLLAFKSRLLSAATLRQFEEAGIPRYCFYPDGSFLDHGPDIWQALPLYNCLFTTKSFHTTDPGVQSHVRNMRHVAHGYDPAVHRPVSAASWDAATKGWDVTFVGYWSPKKEALLKSVINGCPDRNIAIWGPGWERADAVVRSQWRGRGAYGDELALIHHYSRINLGLLVEAQGGAPIGDQVTVRTWQIPACGAFLLHEDTAELRGYFEPGREVGVFTSAEDLPEKVNQYLNDESARQAIAKAGYERCQRCDYTYGAAARQIVAYHAAARPQP